MSWTCGDEPSGNINLLAEDRLVELVYRIRRSGGEWEAVRERVKLAYTAYHYGGERL